MLQAQLTIERGRLQGRSETLHCSKWAVRSTLLELISLQGGNKALYFYISLW